MTDFGSRIFIEKVAIENPDRGAFVKALEAEMGVFVSDADGYFWSLREPYWRQFDRWPWRRQAYEVVVLIPLRRLRNAARWHLCLRWRKDDDD